jgi:hypothetical protein
MGGDIDNIVKPIIDGMKSIFFPDDRVLERIVVQKSEPGVDIVFQALTPTLVQAVETDPPVVCIRPGTPESLRPAAARQRRQRARRARDFLADPGDPNTGRTRLHRKRDGGPAS